MKKITLLATLFSLALLSAPSAHAQFGGCGDSPENPTLILAGLASGAFVVSQIKTRIHARRSSRNKDLQ
jgi:XrtJ-associated TM-motif-TM protein